MLWGGCRERRGHAVWRVEGDTAARLSPDPGIWVLVKASWVGRLWKCCKMCNAQGRALPRKPFKRRMCINGSNRRKLEKSLLDGDVE